MYIQNGKLSIEMQSLWKLLLGVYFVGFLILLTINTHKVVAAKEERVICSVFNTQKEAQQKFNSDPVRYSLLDRDQDGVPCESLPK